MKFATIYLIAKILYGPVLRPIIVTLVDDEESKVDDIIIKEIDNLMGYKK